MDFRNPNIGKSVVRRIPHHSIRQTAKEMKALALEGQTSPIVRGFALETLRRVKPKDAISEIGALYYACCREIHYVGDPISSEFLQHPEVTVNTAAGDCDDMSILLASTLCMSEMLSVGYPMRFALVGFKGGPISHVYLEASVEGRWLALDPVAGPAAQQMLSDVTTKEILNVS